MKNISKVGLIKESWVIVKENYKLIYALLIAFILYQFVQSLISAFFENSILSVLISLAFFVITVFLEIGFIKISLKIVDKKAAKFQELWAYPQYLLRMLGATILYSIAILVGLIPGIYLAIRLQFYSYTLLDKDKNIMESLKGSWEMTKGNVINLTLFMFLIFAINFLGALALLVGLLITIPISFIAVTLLYRKLG